MKISEKNSMERTFLSNERNALSEERTILAYIRTELSIVGVIAIILKFYFDDFYWAPHIAISMFIIFGISIAFESIKIRKLKEKRKKYQEKHPHFKL
ncbi:MAG: DUF202 domain-containing protein [Nanoarchaeota archaeon]|nr:DUF202 domain-containing protein [Nanoarchaeota archaeon]